MLFLTPVLAAASELPKGSILQFDQTTLIYIGIQLFNVIVLIAVLSRFLYKPVAKYLNDRTERFTKEHDSARKDRDDAAQLKEKYEELIAEIENERDEVLQDAHKKAMEKSDQMLFDARREADLAFDRAMQELEVEKNTQADELKRQIVDLSVLIAGRIVEINTDRDVHDRLFDEAMAEWRDS